MKWNSKNKRWYETKGYIFTKIKDEFEVKIEDLSKYSTAKVNVKCDCCNKKLKPITWSTYFSHVKSDGKYYCRKCAIRLFGSINLKKTLFDKTQSFAQWGTDNICKDFLEKYWDYEKNININPFNITKSCNQKVFIKCQIKDYHGSYEVICDNFVKGSRCPYCTTRNGKVHLLDSLGALYPDVLGVWSNKNKNTPFEYTPSSHQEVWWKCLNGEHKDFKRQIQSSRTYEFRCPECQYSKGEKRIADMLVLNNINYISQKTFEKLIGLNGGNLSYNFYLPDYNLLIEYQGEFHDGNGREYTRKNLDAQKEHDKRKKEYAKLNNYNILEIWYRDFNNIEEILKKELRL